MGDLRTCRNCKFFVTEDDGYSNWTVTDTICDCLVGAHPDLPQDEFGDWGPDNIDDRGTLKYAQQCGRFLMGDGIHIDCDREDADYDADDPLVMYAAYLADCDDETKAAFAKWTTRPTPDDPEDRE